MDLGAKFIVKTTLFSYSNVKSVATISQPSNALMGNETTEVKPPQEVAVISNETNSVVKELKTENGQKTATTPLVC